MNLVHNIWSHSFNIFLSATVSRLASGTNPASYPASTRGWRGRSLKLITYPLPRYLPPVFRKFPGLARHYLNTGIPPPLATQPTVGLDTRQKWVASRSDPLILGDEALSTHWIGDKVGTSDGLDPVQNRRKPAPSGNRTANVCTKTGHYIDPI